MVSSRSKSRSKAKKSVPPSRTRYEEANPTVSIRMPRELRDELVALKQATGVSMAEILRIGMEKSGPDLDAAFERGLKDGYEIAEDNFNVTAYCSHCRQHLSVCTGDNTAKEKGEVAKILYQAGWRCPSCQSTTQGPDFRRSRSK